MSAGDQVVYLDHGGQQRRYVVHLPAGQEPPLLAPAVVMLDGRGGTPWTAIRTTGWSAHADAEGFVAVYPEALRLNPGGPQHFLDNPQMWNAGVGGSDVERGGVDDVGFLNAVLDDLVQRFPIDPSRIYVSGFSNGAAMAFRFAAAEPERVAALALVAGYCRLPDDHPPLRRAVPLFYAAGGRDPLNPVDGGEVALPWGATERRPPVRDSLLRWAALCGAPAEPTRVEESDGLRTEWRGPDLVFHLVAELGHVWPGGHRLLPERIAGPPSDRLAGTAEAWTFLSARAAPVRTR